MMKSLASNNFRLTITRMLTISAIILLICSDSMAHDDEVNIKVKFDMTSIKTIYDDPAKVLANEEGFWANDPAYILSSQWHRGSGVPKNFELWRQYLSELSTKSLDQRQAMPGYKLAVELYNSEDLFLSKAIPHICSFLPNLDTINLNSTVYITAYTYAYAFAIHSDFVVDPTSGQNDLDKMLNLSTHELFHLCQPGSTEDALVDPVKYRFLAQLHNEGLATYVGYTIKPIFPSTEKDHSMMDDPAVVKAKITQVNEIFNQANIVGSQETKTMSWEIGVMDRAYYVAGGHMAKTIDRTLGRAILLETIASGPLSFIDTYNKIVPEEEQIVRFEGPDPNSSLIRLKTAALAKNSSAVKELQKAIAAEFSGQEQSLESSLNSLGYKMLFAFNDAEAAITIFTVATNILPNAGNLWDSRGEAYFARQDYDNSQKCYEKSLELIPDSASAKSMLEQINEVR